MKLQPCTFSMKAVDAFTYDSDIMGLGYDISVALPRSYNASLPVTYPLLLVLDGSLTFAMTSAFVRSMEGELRDAIIVGIDISKEADEGEYLRRRVHQFSPDNNWPMNDGFGAYIQQLFKENFGQFDRQDIGGAPKFYQFICDELLADLQTMYPIDQTDIGLAGVSAGGFFTCYALFQEVSPFTYFIASSPAMAYGDGEIFRMEQQWSERHNDLKAGLYMGAGSLEIQDGFLEAKGKIVSGMTQLAGALASRNYPHLTMKTDIYEGMGHIDSFYAAVTKGLRRFLSV